MFWVHLKSPLVTMLIGGSALLACPLQTLSSKGIPPTCRPSVENLGAAKGSRDWRPSDSLSDNANRLRELQKLRVSDSEIFQFVQKLNRKFGANHAGAVWTDELLVPIAYENPTAAREWLRLSAGLFLSDRILSSQGRLYLLRKMAELANDDEIDSSLRINILQSLESFLHLIPQLRSARHSIIGSIAAKTPEPFTAFAGFILQMREDKSDRRFQDKARAIIVGSYRKTGVRSFPDSATKELYLGPLFSAFKSELAVNELGYGEREFPRNAEEDALVQMLRLAAQAGVEEYESWAQKNIEVLLSANASFEGRRRSIRYDSQPSYRPEESARHFGYWLVDSIRFASTPELQAILMDCLRLDPYIYRFLKNQLQEIGNEEAGENFGWAFFHWLEGLEPVIRMINPIPIDQLEMMDAWLRSDSTRVEFPIVYTRNFNEDFSPILRLAESFTELHQSGRLFLLLHDMPAQNRAEMATSLQFFAEFLESPPIFQNYPVFEQERDKIDAFILSLDEVAELLKQQAWLESD